MRKNLTLRLLVIVTVCYVGVCIWCYLSLQQNPSITDLQIGIIDKYIPKPCYSGPEPRYQLKGASSLVQSWHRLPVNMCFIYDTSDKNEVEIQMEKEWDYIDVNYPQYIMTVSGWIQVIAVNHWNVKPLTVIIVPHSHQDPGWLYNFNYYYSKDTKPTLDTAMDKLSSNPSWRFIWSEVVFLAEWWKEANIGQRSQFKRLLANGQLELVTGGWVMTDEGTAHYAAMLDQLIEGHQWIKKNIGIMPNVSWSVDPFGHSPTMSYLLRKSDQDAMVIQRVHYAVKKHLAKDRNFEFRWRQIWDQEGSTDIFTHMMPFLSYNILYSCGPDPHVCCQFDFSAQKCFRGQKTIPAVEITDENVETIAYALWEQFQKKAELYKGGTILVPHGDDFRYKSGQEWHNQFGNLEKLMKYINSNPAMKTQVKFGTVSEYINEVKENKGLHEFPSLSGDFFTYNDRDDQYWSGYYTSRPHYKHMARRLQDLLRSVEILFTLTLVQVVKHKKSMLLEKLLQYKVDIETARQNLGLFQHHDAITGTARSDAVSDYGHRLHLSYNSLTRLLEMLTHVSLTSRQNQDHIGKNVHVVMNENWESHESLLTVRKINTTNSRKVIFYNSLGHMRQEVVHLIVDSMKVKVIHEQSGSEILHQISPTWNSDHSIRIDAYELSFEVEIPPVSMVTYMIKQTKDNIRQHKHISRIKIIKDLTHQEHAFRNLQFTPEHQHHQVPTFRIDNQHLIATFYKCNGKLQFITRKIDGVTLKSEVKFMSYGTGSWSNPFRDKSGAYTFQPDGPAKMMLPETDSSVYIVEGPVYSKVVTIHSYILHQVILYNVTGPFGAGIHIDNIVDIRNKSLNNKELIMRIESNIYDKDNNLCTDINGFQMHRKRMRKKLTIQGNFYPTTSMASVESNVEKMTLLTSSTHGVASLSQGWLEVVLDRRLMQDDWRGLKEGVNDNIPTHSKFILLFERRESPTLTTSSPLCLPSPLAAILSRVLENQIKHFSVFENKFLIHTDLDLQFKSYASSLPCDIDMLNLRFLGKGDKSVDALWILHRIGVDCGFPNTYYQCEEKAKVIPEHIWVDTEVTDISKTSLTGVNVINKLDSKDNLDIPFMEINTYKVTLS